MYLLMAWPFVPLVLPVFVAKLNLIMTMNKVKEHNLKVYMISFFKTIYATTFMCMIIDKNPIDTVALLWYIIFDNIMCSISLCEVWMSK